MTDATTTADILAADEVAEKYKLAVWHTAGVWICAGLMREGTGPTRAAAVRDWAKEAEIEPPAAKVVPMWAAIKEDAIHSLHSDRVAADVQAWWFRGAVVPCDIVLRETEAKS